MYTSIPSLYSALLQMHCPMPKGFTLYSLPRLRILPCSCAPPTLAVFTTMPLCASYLCRVPLSAIVCMMAYPTLAVFLTLPFVHLLLWQLSLLCPCAHPTYICRIPLSAIVQCVHMMTYPTLAVFLTLPFIHILSWQYSLLCPCAQPTYAVFPYLLCREGYFLLPYNE